MKSNGKQLLSKLGLKCIVWSYTLIVLFPIIWTIYTSFKTNKEFYKNPWYLPEGLHFQNYINAFVKANMASYFLNSIFVTLLALGICITFSILTAYAIARCNFKYKQVLHSFYLMGLFLPMIFGIIPLFMLLNKLHLLNSLIGLSIVYGTSAFPFAIYILVGFLVTVPKDYEEAATIDGCSQFKTLVHIIIPIIKPAIITVLVFQFIWFWNEYIQALTFITSENRRTLPVGLVNLMEQQRYSTDWGALFAGLVLVMIPTMIVYGILQKRITDGVSIGGLKG